jgi:enterobacteria phage integrase
VYASHVPGRMLSFSIRQAHEALSYAAATAGAITTKTAPKKDLPRSIGALIASYYQSEEFRALGDTSKTGYRGRLETMRRDHGHRAVAGLTKDRIEE